MGVPAIQPSMSGGEMSPSMAGRVDLNRYGISLKKARNFLVRTSGGIDNRPGSEFIHAAKYDDKDARLIDFTVGEDVAYIVEFGDFYARFFYDGAIVEHQEVITGVTQANPAVVTAPGHGFLNGQTVRITGVNGMLELNNEDYTIANVTADTFELVGIDSTGFAAYTEDGEATGITEVGTPYAEADLFRLKYTQSIDVMTITHGSYETMDLRRTSGTRFELVTHDFSDGPFQSLNSNEGIKLSASGSMGTVTIESTDDLFTEDHVGSLIYLEQKELRDVKPWTPDQRDVPNGTIQRSDGKYYRQTDYATGGTVGTPYRITGNVRPTHDYGRAWDGPGDVRNDGVNDYVVGSEWEYLHSGFGVARILTYVDARTVTALVTKRFPDAVTGGLPSPGATWTLSGDGTTTVFAIPGRTSTTERDYRVTIDGVPMTPDYNLRPPDEGGQTPPPFNPSPGNPILP
jgi:hypothetical protein